MSTTVIPPSHAPLDKPFRPDVTEFLVFDVLEYAKHRGVPRLTGKVLAIESEVKAFEVADRRNHEARQSGVPFAERTEYHVQARYVREETKRLSGPVLP